MNDSISFFVNTNSTIYFYLLNEIKSVFKINIDNIIKVFPINDKHIIV